MAPGNSQRAGYENWNRAPLLTRPHFDRKVRSVKKRITRLATALTLGTLATIGVTTITDLLTTPQDSGWGAPDTSGTPVAVDGNVDLGTSIDVTLGDSGWG